MANPFVPVLIYVALAYLVFELFPRWDFFGRMSLVNLLVMSDALAAHYLPRLL